MIRRWDWSQSHDNSRCDSISLFNQELGNLFSQLWGDLLKVGRHFSWWLGVGEAFSWSCQDRVFVLCWEYACRLRKTKGRCVGLFCGGWTVNRLYFGGSNVANLVRFVSLELDWLSLHSKFALEPLSTQRLKLKGRSKWKGRRQQGVGVWKIKAKRWSKRTISKVVKRHNTLRPVFEFKLTGLKNERSSWFGE